MRRLIEGISKFQFQECYPRRDFFQNLAKGQSPETMFITCSDSRVSPHLLTQTDPGELFVLRNAGNIVPTHGTGNGGEEATIEYAVSVLGIKDIIVCGHSHCGAMHGLLNPESVNELPSVHNWLQHAETTRAVVHSKHMHLNSEDLLAEAIKENVIVQLDNLRTIPSVNTKIRQGKLKIHGWMYMIENGDVLVYQEKSNTFIPLSSEQVENEEYS